VFLLVARDSKINKLSDIVKTAYPVTITAFDKYMPMVENIMKILDIKYQFKYTNEQHDISDLMHGGKFHWKDNLFLQAQLMDLLSSIIFNPYGAKIAYEKEKFLTKYVNEVLKSYNKCALIKLELNILHVKQKTLTKILESMKNSDKAIQNNADLQIESLLHKNWQKIQTLESQNNYYLALYTHFTKIQVIPKIAIIQFNLTEDIKQHFNESKLIQMMNQTGYDALLRQLNISLIIDYTPMLGQRNLNLSLIGKFKNDNTYNKNKEIVKQHKSQTIINIMNLSNDLLIYKENIIKLYNLCLKTLTILDIGKEKLYLSHDRFVYFLRRLFEQIEKIFNILEKILNKQEEILNILGPYFMDLPISFLDDSDLINISAKIEELSTQKKI
jgi:hypothetical protein